MGGAEEALIAADVFLHAVITFRIHYVEQFGGVTDGCTRTDCLPCLALPCMTGLPVHVCLACLDCLLGCQSRQRRSSPLETLDVTSLILRRCGAGVWHLGVGTPRYPGLSMPWVQYFCMPSFIFFEGEALHVRCMPSKHHAIGLAWCLCWPP